jgi:chemotaxis protein CheZ
VSAITQDNAMTDKRLSRQECLDRARLLVAEIEAGGEDRAQQLLEEFAGHRESIIFQEIGHITRELHDTLSGFQNDERLVLLTKCEIPDAKQRLNYVLNMTDQAARRTLTAVEESIPLNQAIGQRASDLQLEWARFTRRQMEPAEFRALSHRLNEFLGITQDDTSRIHARLMDVLMAQEFQDLTGQVIHRVIHLVQEMEHSLVDLIKFSSKNGAVCPVEIKKGLEGPQINPSARPDVVSSQDEVDDLLSSLGF